jgi:hypothetical protein
VPLSEGCFEMCAKSDLRAEESVRGVEGIGCPDNVGVLFQPDSDIPRGSVPGDLRSGLFRTVVAGGRDCEVCGAWAIGGSEEVDGPGS